MLGRFAHACFAALVCNSLESLLPSGNRSLVLRCTNTRRAEWAFSRILAMRIAASCRFAPQSALLASATLNQPDGTFAVVLIGMATRCVVLAASPIAQSQWSERCYWPRS